MPTGIQDGNKIEIQAQDKQQLQVGMKGWNSYLPIDLIRNTIYKLKQDIFKIPIDLKCNATKMT